MIVLSEFELMHVDEFIDELLHSERVCDIILPRLQVRYRRSLIRVTLLSPRQRDRQVHIHNKTLKPMDLRGPLILISSLHSMKKQIGRGKQIKYLKGRALKVTQEDCL